ncbi:hypothetical protein FRB95_010504 [Tulasnella sp. JGI-2019a]|nr:hypothetical protein FRB95_010504 [Tulasnella sp. JGI-2019a]
MGICQIAKLKVYQEHTQAAQESGKEIFTHEGFMDRLVLWVVVDDQSINVIECPELCELLCYISENLDEHSIPRKTTLSEAIVARFCIHKAETKQSLKCLSKVMFLDGSDDLNENDDVLLDMALTASFIDNSDYHDVLLSDPVKLCRDLISFCCASGQHHEELQQVIVDGNKTGLFTTEIPLLQLLCDLET